MGLASGKARILNFGMAVGIGTVPTLLRISVAVRAWTGFDSLSGMDTLRVPQAPVPEAAYERPAVDIGACAAIR
ncbi:hypothetical protein Ait01nite_041380 [Actinoplanes italicus]|nr:hypothetical protein Ait01nite_041380 [Actinoplanes italicus]